MKIKLIYYLLFHVKNIPNNNNNISIKFIKKNLNYINNLNEAVYPVYKTLNERRSI